MEKERMVRLRKQRGKQRVARMENQTCQKIYNNKVKGHSALYMAMRWISIDINTQRLYDQ